MISPLLVSRRHDRHIITVMRTKFFQLADKFPSVVESPVPSKDSARSGYQRLRFEVGFAGRVESMIENADEAVGVCAANIWGIPSKCWSHFFNVTTFEWRTVNVPSPENDTHIVTSQSQH